MKPKVKEALKRLGYTQEWIDWGFITEEYLMSQLEEIEQSEDKNAEHYRAWGFYQYLERTDSLTDEDIANVFNLKDKGSDQCDLHLNRIIELIHSEKLSKVQFEDLSKYEEVNEAPLQKRYNRSRIIRILKNQGLNSETFDLVKETSDSAIHEFTLEMEGLSHEHLLWFKQNGLNRRVRNISKQKLQSKMYRE